MQHTASVGPYGVPGNADSLHGLIPRGLISMWSGKLSEIPVGWALCDGTLGTPNLVAKFIRGVNSATTDPGSTGGADSVTVVQDAHSHEIPIMFGPTQVVRRSASFATGGSVSSVGDWARSTDTTAVVREKTQSVTATNQAHNNRPAYYELAFIMKL